MRVVVLPLSRRVWLFCRAEAKAEAEAAAKDTVELTLTLPVPLVVSVGAGGTMAARATCSAVYVSAAWWQRL
jgi:hypothetical protein